METVSAWVVTFDPDKAIRLALGPDEPDEDQAILVFLDFESAERYSIAYGMRGASIVPVTVTREAVNPKTNHVAWYQVTHG